MTEALAYLAAFQRRFTEVLRTPLDRTTDTLRATPERFDPDLCAAVIARGGRSAADGLAVYNRQYWLRLLGVLQREYRLTAALLGAWWFNDLAARFLADHPPRGYDLARAADGFDGFVAAAVPDAGFARQAEGAVPRAALVEATRIDAAFRRVSGAPAQPALALTEAEAARLATARLVPSDAFALIDETRPLVALRHGLPDDLGDRHVPVPAPHPDGPRAWLLTSTPAGRQVAPLAPLQARLLGLLCAHPVGVALAHLEASCSAAEAAALPAHARRWLADSVQRGCWKGIAP